MPSLDLTYTHDSTAPSRTTICVDILQRRWHKRLRLDGICTVFPENSENDLWVHILTTGGVFGYYFNVTIFTTAHTKTLSVLFKWCLGPWLDDLLRLLVTDKLQRLICFWKTYCCWKGGKMVSKIIPTAVKTYAHIELVFCQDEK